MEHDVWQAAVVCFNTFCIVLIMLCSLHMRRVVDRLVEFCVPNLEVFDWKLFKKTSSPVITTADLSFHVEQ